MLASLKSLLGEFWDYLNDSKYLKELCPDQISEIPSTTPTQGGTASVYQAELTIKTKKGTTTKVVALKKLKFLIEDTKDDEQHRKRKVSRPMAHSIVGF